ncbi:MAG TPA: hypothetical protein VNS10_18260 [Gemmatimonadaceae bacterium]|jgi:hypothetical protein|nr:hypothetical protein [Gemmatimonadaceae bacterium]
MSLFRSEDHVERWLSENGFDRGESMPIDAVLRLARGWYTDPRSATWRPRTRDESQRVLTESGFVGDFWQLP